MKCIWFIILAFYLTACGKNGAQGKTGPRGDATETAILNGLSATCTASTGVISTPTINTAALATANITALICSGMRIQS